MPLPPLHPSAPIVGVSVRTCHHRCPHTPQLSDLPSHLQGPTSLTARLPHPVPNLSPLRSHLWRLSANMLPAPDLPNSLVVLDNLPPPPSAPLPPQLPPCAPQCKHVISAVLKPSNHLIALAPPHAPPASSPQTPCTPVAPPSPQPLLPLSSQRWLLTANMSSSLSSSSDGVGVEEGVVLRMNQGHFK